MPSGTGKTAVIAAHLAERDTALTHTTILRWVQPEVLT
jgi:hypothetical protein